MASRRNPLAKRYEFYYDAMIDAKIIEFIEIHPVKADYFKALIMKDYKKYLRAPTQYKRNRGLI